jgi:hypothetical protein
VSRWLVLFSRDENAFARLTEEARSEHLVRCGRWAKQLGTVTSAAVVGLAGPPSSQRVVRHSAAPEGAAPIPVSACCYIDAGDEGDARDLALTHPDALYGSILLVPLVWAQTH